jgi:putative hydrolase of HD superfamily
MDFARQRLKTDLGRQLGSEITETDSTAWWFEGRDHWWTNT